MVGMGPTAAAAGGGDGAAEGGGGGGAAAAGASAFGALGAPAEDKEVVVVLWYVCNRPETITHLFWMIYCATALSTFVLRLI